MIRRLSLRPLLATGAIALLGGCAVIAGPVPEAVLRLDPTPPAPLSLTLNREIILSPVAASQSTGSRRYVYVETASPGQVRMAATLFWEAPPPMLVEQALQRGLSARLGERVASGTATRADTGRLSVTLDRFEERSGASSEALISLRAALLDGQSHAIVLDRAYCGRARIAGVTPSDRSAAFDAALNIVMDSLASDIRQPGDPRQAPQNPQC